MCAPEKIKTGRNFSCCCPFKIKLLCRVNVTDLAESIFYKDAAQNPDQQRGKRSQIRQYSVLPSRRNIYRGNSKDPPPSCSFKSSFGSVHIYMSGCSAEGIFTEEIPGTGPHSFRSETLCFCSYLYVRLFF
jgi:hypothetical protein